MHAGWRWGIGLLLGLGLAGTARATDLERELEHWLTASFPDPHGRWEAWVLDSGSVVQPGAAHQVVGVVGACQPKKIMTFRLAGENGPEWRVRARVAKFVRVPVATRILRRGRTPGPDDWTWEERNADGLPADVLTRSEDLRGQQCKKVVTRGEALTAHALEPVPDVTPGAAVTLRVVGDGVVILAEARALERGRIGDEVRVATQASGETVRAQLIGPETAQFTLTSRRVP